MANKSFLCIRFCCYNYWWITCLLLNMEETSHVLTHVSINASSVVLWHSQKLPTIHLKGSYYLHPIPHQYNNQRQRYCNVLRAFFRCYLLKRAAQWCPWLPCRTISVRGQHELPRRPWGGPPLLPGDGRQDGRGAQSPKPSWCQGGLPGLCSAHGPLQETQSPHGYRLPGGTGGATAQDQIQPQLLQVRHSIPSD